MKTTNAGQMALTSHALDNIAVRLHNAAKSHAPLCNSAFERARGRACESVIRKLSDARADGREDDVAFLAELAMKMLRIQSSEVCE